MKVTQRLRKAMKAYNINRNEWYQSRAQAQRDNIHKYDRNYPNSTFNRYY